VGFTVCLLVGTGVARNDGLFVCGGGVITVNIDFVGIRVGGMFVNTVGAKENAAQLNCCIVGCCVGLTVGCIVGLNVGFCVGLTVGCIVGLTVGR
jgi:hypothetical protein